MVFTVCIESLIFNGISGPFAFYLFASTTALFVMEFHFVLGMILFVNFFECFREVMQDIFRKFDKILITFAATLITLYEISFMYFERFKEYMYLNTSSD
jgi:hypothetical protein